MGNSLLPYSGHTEILAEQPMKEKIYELAELSAFMDILRAGYASQVIKNTSMLAGMATEAANKYPEYHTEFKRLVGEYVEYASSKIRGG